MFKHFTVVICSLVAGCISSPGQAPPPEGGSDMAADVRADLPDPPADAAVTDDVTRRDFGAVRDMPGRDQAGFDMAVAGSRQRIDLDARFGTLSNFVIVVPLPAEADEDALRFVDATGAELDYELERDMQGRWAWVRVPEIVSPGAHIYLEHVEGAPNPLSTWESADFAAVYHVEDLSADDSAYGLSGTFEGNPSRADGLIGYGVTTVSGFANLPGDSVFIVNDNDVLTGEVWVAASASDLFESSYPLWGAGNGVGWFVEVRPDGTPYLQFGVDDGDGDPGATTFATGIASMLPVADGIYHHIVFVIDRDVDTLALYVDGALVEEKALSFDTDNDQGSSVTVRIGAAGDGSNAWPKRIDEVRFSEVKRDEAWIAATHGMTYSVHSQDATDDWIVVNPPESLP